MISPSDESESKRTTITLLDGGFGTTLEQIFQQDITHKPLWSAKTIMDNPDIIIQTHLAFLRANAKIISAATYQCSYLEFERAGLDHDSAIKITRKAVELADQARTMYEKEVCSAQLGCDEPQSTKSEKAVRIALSFGPFGASLKPAQEWDGCYPPPYGPMAFNTGDASLNRNMFRKDEEAASEGSIRALAEFHRERLMMFLSDEEGRRVWEKIDCIAFETIPLVREIKAIRIAVGQAFEGMEHLLKPWWITGIFPDGIFPEGKNATNGLTVHDVACAMLGELEISPGRQAPAPRGVGVNCVSVEHVPRLLKELEVEVVGGVNLQSLPLWLVIYPNAGDVFDLASQRCIEEEDLMRRNEVDKWAQSLVSIAEGSAKRGLWEEIIVGGCCMARPSHIKRLYELFATAV